MVEPMLAACPSFVATWAAFCAVWGNEPAKAPLYVVLGQLADHLVEQLQAGMTEDFPAVFGVVERWHREGEHYVREAATIGLLEGLQNEMGRKGVNPEAFDRWLMPESKRWWDRLHRFWAGDTGALREG